MGNEPEPEKGLDWKMPEPVFRTTEGRRPGVSEIDIPTEPGFAERSTEPVTTGQTVRPSTKTRIRHKKKAGRANSLRTTAVVLIISVLAIVGAVVYFLFFSRNK